MAKKISKAAVLFSVLFCLMLGGLVLADNLDAGIYTLNDLPFFEHVFN